MRFDRCVICDYSEDKSSASGYTITDVDRWMCFDTNGDPICSECEREIFFAKKPEVIKKE